MKLLNTLFYSSGYIWEGRRGEFDIFSLKFNAIFLLCRLWLKILLQCTNIFSKTSMFFWQVVIFVTSEVNHQIFLSWKSFLIINKIYLSRYLCNFSEKLKIFLESLLSFLNEFQKNVWPNSISWKMLLICPNKYLLYIDHCNWNSCMNTCTVHDSTDEVIFGIGLPLFLEKIQFFTGDIHVSSTLWRRNYKFHHRERHRKSTKTDIISEFVYSVVQKSYLILTCPCSLIDCPNEWNGKIHLWMTTRQYLQSAPMEKISLQFRPLGSRSLLSQTIEAKSSKSWTILKNYSYSIDDVNFKNNPRYPRSWCTRRTRCAWEGWRMWKRITKENRFCLEVSSRINNFLLLTTSKEDYKRQWLGVRHKRIGWSNIRY